RDRRATGLFIAEGVREVQRAADAGLPMRDLFWCPPVLENEPWIEALASAAQATSRPPNLFTIDPRVLAKLAYREHPEGVLAVFEQPQWDLQQIANSTTNPLWLVCAGIEKPGNLGAMVRSADAAGATGVMVVDGVVDPFNPNAIRA